MIQNVGAMAAATGSVTTDKPQNLKQAAEAFEGLFLAMLLKTARQAGEAGRSPDADSTTESILDMAEEQMATQIAKGRGCGFAATILKQLQPRSVEQGQQPATGAAP